MVPSVFHSHRETVKTMKCKVFLSLNLKSDPFPSGPGKIKNIIIEIQYKSITNSFVYLDNILIFLFYF